jgi:acyl carrier protein
MTVRVVFNTKLAARWLLHLIVTAAAAAALILGISKPGFLSVSWPERVGLLVVGVAGGICGLWFVTATEIERAQRHMEGREPLNDKEFGRRFFSPQQAEIAAKLRVIMARHIPIELSRLNPDDRIVEDIRMDALDSMATAEFVLEIEKEFGISIPDAAAARMRTLRDVAEFVSQTKKNTVA